MELDWLPLNCRADQAIFTQVVLEVWRTTGACFRRTRRAIRWRDPRGCRVYRCGADRECVLVCYVVFCPAIYDTDEAHVVTLRERPFNIIRASLAQFRCRTRPKLKPRRPKVAIDSVTRPMIFSITRNCIGLNVVGARGYLIIGHLQQPLRVRAARPYKVMTHSSQRRLSSCAEVERHQDAGDDSCSDSS